MPSLRLAILIPILLLGLFLRAGSAWQGPAENLPDSAAYERIARGIHRDGTFAEKGPGTPAHPQAATNYSPGLPLLVAGWFDLTGSENLRSARLLLALISALSIPIAWMLAGRLAPGGLRTATEVAAAATVAFYPAVIVDAGMLLTEPLAGTLIAGGLLSGLVAGDRRGVSPHAVLSGILFGLAAVVRPEFLPIGLLAGVALWLTFRRGRTTGAAIPAVAVVTALGLTVAPWMAWAGTETGRPVPVSTGGGQTLFTGSVLASGGDPQKVMPGLLAGNPEITAKLMRENRASGEDTASITPERVFEALAGRRFPGVPTDLALTRMGRDNYLEALRSDPVGLAGFLAAKSVRVWWRGRSDLTGSAGGRIAHWLVIAFAALGLAGLAVRRRPEIWPVLALTVGATAVGAVLVASPRRTLAIWPVVAALSGLGVAGSVTLCRSALAATGRRRAPARQPAASAPAEPDTAGGSLPRIA